MHPSCLAALLALTTCLGLQAQDPPKAPERKIQGTTIVSDRDPKVRIDLPPEARYVGADRWILYGVADCEIQVFVEVDATNTVQRLYWVQFEGYIPSRPDAKYQYPFTQSTTIGGLQFDVRTRVGPNSGPTRAGSDQEHVRTLLAAKDYKLPEAFMSVRLVHLPDPEKRKELMIIYAEDLKTTGGHSAADLSQGGKAQDQLPALEKALLERARTRLKLTQ
jgi:hypothetical protein